MVDRDADEMFCPECGAVIDASANFCPECGAENDVVEPAEGDPSVATVPPGTGSPPGTEGDGGGKTVHERLVDRGWSLASGRQALAGVEAGVYAALTGLSATLVLTAVTAPSLLTGDPPRIDAGGSGAAATTPGEAVNLLLGPIDATPTPVELVGEFVVLVYYSANFVPIAVDAGARDVEFDLLSALTPVGVLPVAARATVVAVLVVFGYRAAASQGYGSYVEAAGAGATVAVGYLLLLVPGALLVGYSAGGGTAEPALNVAPALTGLAIPGVLAVVCGGVGGLLREHRRRA